MEMYDWLCTSNAVFNGKLVNELFEAIDVDGPLMAILDGQGNMWVSDENRFGECNLEKPWLENLCRRAADGSEPVVSQFNNCGIVLSCLRTEKRHCCYISIILPQHSPEATLTKLDLCEAIIDVSNRLACSLEQNESMHEVYRKLSSSMN